MARTTRSSAAAAAKALSTPAKTKEPPQQLSSPPATPVPGGRKRTRQIAKKEEVEDTNELPHNLGASLLTPGAEEGDEQQASPPKKRTKRVTKSESAAKAKADEVAEVGKAVKAEPEDPATPSTAKKTPRKKGKNSLVLGESPYPDYLRPTPEECHEVVRILEGVHGKANAPKVVPPPDLSRAGCGEVPSILDAIIRTRLSAHTTDTNAARAFQGLVKRFGVVKEGIGKGSVDWNAVRLASYEDVVEAIKCGGLSKIKAKDIQGILNMTYQQNQERGAALKAKAAPPGADREPESEKHAEIEKADNDIISLDHIHLLSTSEALSEMMKFPGVGWKTASCVALFCMQRPSFAVDTHVFRLCQYLGWVPKTPKQGEPKIDRDPTFIHCDVRIPDELKYALHQLLIKHGKKCPRCRGITGQSSAGWEEGCALEHLVKRHGARKGGVSTAYRKKAKEAAGAGAVDDEAKNEEIKNEVREDAEAESELSDAPDEVEEDVKEEA
jgi:endonuclease III